ncbi:unnamed protein product [Paramecium primaurelia]|uniref:Transmembrane protein n=1 Tax=Paramecium primaurelia TaxID=5886 RepID=A0A8S1QFY7_PARPR|nr:unnamed protein product [Paramecium primaurelia]
MMSILTIALCITLITSTTFDLYQICNCSQLIFQYDCLSAILECNWDYDNNECYDKPCSDIYYQNACLQQSKRCYWAQSSCFNFTSCGQMLESKYNYDCQGQNYYCPQYYQYYCLSISDVQECSSITDPDICNYYQSLQGICFWNGQSCTLAQSCTQLFNNGSSNCPRQYCQNSWDQSYQQEFCSPNQCSNQTTQSQCAQGIQTFGPYLQNIIGCYWNPIVNLCQEYVPSQMNYANCYLYSRGTYYWNSKTKENGDCVPCSQFQELLIISIFITTLI